MSRIYRYLAALRRLKPAAAPVRTARSARTRLWVTPLEDRTVPTAYTVNATTDTGTGSGTTGDLRYCITQATAAAGNSINFDTTVFGTPQTITLTSALPTITQGMTIQ